MIRIELPGRQDAEDVVTALQVAAQILPPPDGPRMTALADQIQRAQRTLPTTPKEQTDA